MTDDAPEAASDGSTAEAADATDATAARSAGPTDGTDAALRATDLSQSFGDVSVLDGASLAVGRGELVAVVGPNGSGKSTLLELLAGIRAPDRGSVTVAPAPDGAADDRRDVGYLPQRPAFREGFTARDTLKFYARLLDGDGDVPGHVDETLDRVGLAGVAGRTVGSLSGGMTRLLGVGQAILGRPSALVLDEPGSGLDPAMVERLFRVLETLTDEGTGVVVASHNLAAVEAHADAVFLLDRGRFAASGAPAELLAATGTETLVDAFLATVRGDEGESTVRTGRTPEVTDG